MPLPAPVTARAADPGVEDATPLERHALAEPVDQILQLGFLLGHPDFVSDLVGHRHHRPGIVGERRRRDEDQMGASMQTTDDLGRGLLARKLTEKFLDVLDLERTLLEFVLGDVIFHDRKLALYTPDLVPAVVFARYCRLGGADDR